MNLNLYSIHDVKAGVYLAPFVARNDVEAKRQIAAALKDPNMSGSSLVQTPSDFALCAVASFDDVTGVFDASMAGPIVVCPVNTLVESRG